MAATSIALVATASVLLSIPTSDAATAVASASVTKSIVATRTHLVGGVDVPADTRNVQVTVDQTQSLRDRQAVTVKWSGAHPTGGTYADTTAIIASQEEYPVVVMQCRGVDSPTAPAARRISPSTCWTQSPAERFKADFNSLFPPFRVDRYAPADQRRQLVGVPQPLPKKCGQNAGGGAQHWVPFIATDGTTYTTYPGGPDGCAGIAPDQVNLVTAQPSNTTYGITEPDGTGSTKFVINTAASNASLGCSDAVPCSLVVVPIMGISCDVEGSAIVGGTPVATDDRTPGMFQARASAICSLKGHFSPRQDAGGGDPDLAVSGQLWWSQSNWRNRVTIPLGFAQASNVCDLVSNAKPSFVYGSQTMVPATQQWAPAFCLDPKKFKFRHVQNSEPASRNLLDSGLIDAAFVAGPPKAAFVRPVVQAPVAVSGFAIAYRLDNDQGREVVNLRLTPRLLAKLLTMSYPAGVGIRREYAALSSNPLDIVEDPEFRALNPGSMRIDNGYNGIAASTLFAMSSDSDVMTAVTSYINADPEARAWLNGRADPWGMVVNPNYKGIVLPVESWPVKDNFVSKVAASGSPCLQLSPVPYLPLIAAPVSNPATVTFNLQYGLANSQIECKDPDQLTRKLVSLGRLVPGRRALFGLVSLADADRYQLPAAQLLTHVDSGAPATFTDTTGRTFVGPSAGSLKAAASLLKPVKAMGTWPIPYAAFRGAAGKAAYPGIMLISMDVATKGIVGVDASRFAQLLRFAVTTGQTPGLGNGQLPPGYLPLTAADGLSSLVAYSQTAASAIAAQQGYVPAVDGSLPPPSPTPIPTAQTPGGTGGSSGPSNGGSSPSGGTPGASQSSMPTPVGSASSSQPSIKIVDVGTTKDIGAGALGNAVPALLGLAIITGIAAAVLLAWRRT